MGYEEGDLEIDCADFGFDTDCTGNVARSNELHVMNEMKVIDEVALTSVKEMGAGQ